MQVKAKLTRYEDLEFSITLTAPVKDWREALTQVEKLIAYGHIAWPLGGFASCIREMLNGLDRTHADVLVRKEEK